MQPSAGRMPPPLIPALVDGLCPPTILGTAALAARAYAGATLDQLLAQISRAAAPPVAEAWDTALAYELSFHRAAALAVQAELLNECRLFRVGPGAAAGAQALRLLAFMAPGDLMMNTPLDFLTAHLNVTLDLLYLAPGQDLPAAIPDHDVAIFAVSETDAPTRARLAALRATWPRPTLNDPLRIGNLSRDGLAALLAGRPGLLCPAGWRATSDAPAPDGTRFPLLVRPLGSHGGQGLARMETAAQLHDYVQFSPAEAFYLCPFVDYRGADGKFRKYRIAVIDGAPFLCHMAVSDHWMVHYLNADMAGSAEKRAEEAAAMAGFDSGFACRHATALEALHQAIGLDFYSIDCAELQDGRLLVFEADVAAIIHMLDPPEVFPYKPPQMQLVFAAFGAMLRRAAKQ